MESGAQFWTIRQASKELGMPTSLIRKFCNTGLVTGVRRVSGYRTFGNEQMEWLSMLKSLNNCGFTVAEMKKFKTATSDIQKALLETKRRQIWQKIEDLQAGIDFIERRIESMENQNSITE